MEDFLLKYANIAKEFIKKANSLWNKVTFINVAEMLNSEVDLRELSNITWETQKAAYSKKSEFQKHIDSLPEEKYDELYKEITEVEDLFYLADSKFSIVDSILYELKDLYDKSEEEEYLKKFQDVKHIETTSEMTKVLKFKEFVNEQYKVPYYDEGGWHRPSEYKNLELGKNTKTEEILRFIYDGGEEGRTWKEIHRFIVEDIKGRKQKLSGESGETNRGYYASFFTYYLPHFAEKTNGKWRIADPILLSYFSKNTENIESELAKKGDDVYSEISASKLDPDDPELIRKKIKLLKNPHISKELLLNLAINDKNKEVRTAAKNHPKFKEIEGVDFLKDFDII